MVQFVLALLAQLTLFADILIVVSLLLILSYLMKPKNNNLLKVKKWVSDNNISLALVVATIATAGSLFFSEVAGFPPCKLCWYQRIFMYPLPILLGISLFTDDKTVRKYVLPLALIGFSIAVYHYALQMYPTILPCSDEVASCAAKQFAYFGYITIPMMSASAFFLIIILQFVTFLPFKKQVEGKY